MCQIDTCQFDTRRAACQCRDGGSAERCACATCQSDTQADPPVSPQRNRVEGDSHSQLFAAFWELSGSIADLIQTRMAHASRVRCHKPIDKSRVSCYSGRVSGRPTVYPPIRPSDHRPGLRFYAARAHTASGQLPPRVRLASRLYATGACRTKKEAAEAAGISRAWFNLLTNHNEEVKRLVGNVDTQVGTRAIEMSAVIRELGRKAILTMDRLMSHSEREDIVLRAAQDLADRSPETSKIQKHQMVIPQLAPEDAKTLAESLVAAARVKAEFMPLSSSDFIRVEPSPNQIGAGNGKDAEGAIAESQEEQRGQDAKDHDENAQDA